LRNSLRNIVIKELKELLRDPKTIIGIVIMPLIMFPLMGFAFNISQTAVEEATRHASVAVLDIDGGSWAQNFKAFLTANPNVTMTEVQGQDVSTALDKIKGTNTSVLLVIPSGFSLNLTNGLPAKLDAYTLVKSISIAGSGKATVINLLISFYESRLVFETIQSLIKSSPLPGRTPLGVLNPIDLSASTVVKGKVIGLPPNALFSIIMSQSIMLPVVIMTMLMYAMSIAATAIAIEKEEKTLETLLSLPVGRLTILTGKLAGSIVVAIASAIAYMIGFNNYMSSITSGIGAETIPSVDLQALGLAPSITSMVLLGITIFVTVTSALALAISLAVFSENVRSAQAMVGLLYLPIMIPSFILMFADIEILPNVIQFVLYAIPYTHSILAAKAVFMGDYPLLMRSIAYISIFTVVVLYIAAKIFTTEKVVTARISFKKIRIRR